MRVLTLDALRGLQRILLEVDLAPRQGERFQPTGFPDLGAATYALPDGTPMLLVESVQSMANRLESVGWDAATSEPVKVLDGLPYARVVDTEGRFLTSSRLEPHRLASAYVKDGVLKPNGSAMRDHLRDKLGLAPNRRVNWLQVYSAVFALDPLSLLHGVFFSDKGWPGNPKIARALAAFVEARNARDVLYGGIKRDDVTHRRKEGKLTAEEGYGHIPYSRREFVADRVTAYFSLDLQQMDGYGLPAPATDLLKAVALWEIQGLLESGLRFRTACDLQKTEMRWTSPGGRWELPDSSQLRDQICDLAEKSARNFADPHVTEVVWTSRKQPKTKPPTTDESQAHEEEGDEDAGEDDEP